MLAISVSVISVRSVLALADAGYMWSSREQKRGGVTQDDIIPSYDDYHYVGDLLCEALSTKTANEPIELQTRRP
jgi:hypothetical protein